MFRNRYLHPLAFFMGCLLCGCGTTKSRSATEQLLISDAVDRSVASIDFLPLSGQRVYLDTQYVKTVKGAGFVNADYIISSLRQQMLAANCYLEEERNSADYIAELRIGALGTDAHDVTFGIPASTSLSNAASLVPNAPPIPTIPEISLGKSADEVAAAKIAVFVYHRETRRTYWQSGLAEARSSAKDRWLLGAGPFQSGTLHEGVHLAGEELEIPLMSREVAERKTRKQLNLYSRSHLFGAPPSVQQEPEQPLNPVLPASHSEEVAKPADNPATKPAAAANPAANPAAE